MARCSGVCPIAPSAFITSASVFHSFVFSSSLKSWLTVVGLVPSNSTRTLRFFFTLGHPDGFDVRKKSTLMGRPLFRAFKFSGEKIIHDQCRDESGDTKVLLRIII